MRLVGVKAGCRIIWSLESSTSYQTRRDERCVECGTVRVWSVPFGAILFIRNGVAVRAVAGGDSAQSAARRLTELDSELRPRWLANTLAFSVADQGMPFAFFPAARENRVVPAREYRAGSAARPLE